MTRKQVKAILSDISNEQLDSILSLYGSGIEKAKVTAETAQLALAKDLLKLFDGVDIKELQGKITQLSALFSQALKRTSVGYSKSTGEKGVTLRRCRTCSKDYRKQAKKMVGWGVISGCKIDRWHCKGN